jgi:hypothetical protein
MKFYITNYTEQFVVFIVITLRDHTLSGGLICRGSKQQFYLASNPAGLYKRFYMYFPLRGQLLILTAASAIKPLVQKCNFILLIKKI